MESRNGHGGRSRHNSRSQAQPEQYRTGRGGQSKQNVAEYAVRNL